MTLFRRLCKRGAARPGVPAVSRGVSGALEELEMRLVYDQVQIAGLPADGAVAVFDEMAAGARTSKRTAPQWQPPRCVTSGGAASSDGGRAGDEGDEQRRAPVAAEAAFGLKYRLRMTSSRPPSTSSRTRLVQDPRSRMATQKDASAPRCCRKPCPNSSLRRVAL